MRGLVGTWILGLSLLLAALAASGCGRTVTPAELDGYESRAYDDHDRREVLRAAVTALRSLGYDVVVVDAAAGRVKTAPKLVVVHAARTSATTAIAVGDAIAWTIDVRDAGAARRGAIVHAEPRLYSSGQAVDATRLNHEYADRTFRTLYAEIESNLPRTTSSTSAELKKR